MNELMINETLQELNFYGEFRTAHGYPRYDVSSKGFLRAKCATHGTLKKPDKMDTDGRAYYMLYSDKQKVKQLICIDDLIATTFPPNNPGIVFTRSHVA